MSAPYDLSLLALAPPASYLQERHSHVPSLLAEKWPPQVAPVAYPASGGASEEYPQGDPITSRPLPFWRTRKAVFIFLIAIVIIGAVIGGAVGGTRKSYSNEASSSSGSFSPDRYITITVTALLPQSMGNQGVATLPSGTATTPNEGSLTILSSAVPTSGEVVTSSAQIPTLSTAPILTLS